MPEEICGASAVGGPCQLQRGHNIGRADIPDNHEYRTPEKRWVLTGDLDWLEYAIADYIAKWGEHLTGHPYDGNIAGIPCATANMAMTVIRKNIRPWVESRRFTTGGE